MPRKSIRGSRISSGNAGRRTYQSGLRQRQAEETRTRILAAAARLFAELGYARTTLGKIADAAGVSPETVQTHGPKAALMIAAVEYATFGAEGDRSVFELDYGRTFLAFDDARGAIDYLIDVQTEVHERSVPFFRALEGGAANDPELERYYAGLIEGVGRQNRRILGVARDRGWLRDDAPFDEVVEWAALISSIGVYDRMVVRDGFSVEAYKRWFRTAVDALVLRPD